jgi:hypothetical protein
MRSTERQRKNEKHRDRQNEKNSERRRDIYSEKYSEMARRERKKVLALKLFFLN